jgi:outer membrane protein assembly factor BamB
MRRLTVSALLLLLFAVAPAPAAADPPFPETIALPNGLQPEGIAIRGWNFYVGSLATGAVVKGDLRTGECCETVVGPQQGRVAVGLKVDRSHRLFVAGGPTGQAYVYDVRTGAELAVYQLATGPSFINDVVVSRRAAWFRFSFNAVLFRVPIARGELGAQTDVETLPLSGDFQLVPGEFNSNGIEVARGGRTLVIVNSFTGELFTVDPETGVTRLIDLGGGDVESGDGILLTGRKLFVVQNFLNRVAVVRLRGGLTEGRVLAHITDTDLDIPTTIAKKGRRLYVVNGRFTTPATPDTEYQVVQLRKPNP